jgi:hypothetical protein
MEGGYSDGNEVTEEAKETSMCSEFIKGMSTGI